MSSPFANRSLRAAWRSGIHCVMRRIVAAALAAGLAALALPACAYTVIEYYDATLDHYFMTPLANEIEELDSGQIAGWSRTGRVFDAYPSSAAATAPR